MTEVFYLKNNSRFLFPPADQVIVLDKGKVIQKGKFGQLANEPKSIFNKLIKSQLEATL